MSIVLLKSIGLIAIIITVSALMRRDKQGFIWSLVGTTMLAFVAALMPRSPEMTQLFILTVVVAGGYLLAIKYKCYEGAEKEEKENKEEPPKPKNKIPDYFK